MKYGVSVLEKILNQVKSMSIEEYNGLYNSIKDKESIKLVNIIIGSKAAKKYEL